MTIRSLRTVRQIAAENPAITENVVRWWIWRAESNGFDRCLRRIGRRVYIDTDELDRWIRDHSGGELGAPE